MPESKTYSVQTFDACLPRLIGYLRAGVDVELARELEQEIGFGFDEDLFYLAYVAAQIATSKTDAATALAGGQ